MFIMCNPQSVNTQHTTHRKRKIDAKANCNHWSPVLWPFVCQSATEINAGPSDTTGEISTSSSPSFPETPAERIRASKKGKRASKRKAPDNESDDEALKDVRQQGEKVASFLDSLQQTHTQQLAIMSQFMGSIVKILDKEQNEKWTLIQDYFWLLRDNHHHVHCLCYE